LVRVRVKAGAGARVRVRAEVRAEVRAGSSVHACIHSMHVSLLATSVLLKTTTSLAEHEGGEHGISLCAGQWVPGSNGGRDGSFIL
tara:strand:+ start:1040 stop:1297 length:258 start_codon:yes stop_codon:yes gene_type:complete